MIPFAPPAASGIWSMLIIAAIIAGIVVCKILRTVSKVLWYVFPSFLTSWLTVKLLRKEHRRQQVAHREKTQ